MGIAMLSGIETWIKDTIKLSYSKSEYPEFLEMLTGMKNNGLITPKQYEEILSHFPEIQPQIVDDWQEDEDQESYMKNPPDLEPLANEPIRKWVNDCKEELRLSKNNLIELLGIDDKEVCVDIQENALHILDGCNDPRNNGENWGENHQGLVYGMVQSGKTASMLNVISLGIKAGYRLFIILAGDKSSLRDQTQDRINKAFNLDNGVNRTELIQSPTYSLDFKHVPKGYSENFRVMDRFSRKMDWTTIIVMKKNTSHINHLTNQFEALNYHLKKERGLNVEEEYPTMILDDEADYASQNTDAEGDGSTIHEDLKKLRSTIPRNCYVAYTATPQACLSADPEDPIGYPKDFWWLIEPFTIERNGLRTPKSYLGSWETFWIDDDFLLHKISKKDWPHHIKDNFGRSRGVYLPPIDEEDEGLVVTGITDTEYSFLVDILENRIRKPPKFIQNAVIDYLITCGVRWWRNWKKLMRSEKPSREEIERSKEYDHHAMMAHLSLKQENQEMIRRLISMVWIDAKKQFYDFDESKSPDDHSFRQRWRKQLERSEYMMGFTNLEYSEIRYFIERCIEITEIPILNHRTSPYQKYIGNPWIYLLNSTDDGMELQYSKNKDREIRTKKSSIIVGGNILSRGLTIEGLAVSVFCRTQMLSMGDTNLQMCRWFGHKQNHRDLICIHLQDISRNIFRQIAEADRYLRLQIKTSLHYNHTPMQVLVELRNSPFFRSTSKAKSNFLLDSKGMGFSGKQALLKAPDFQEASINHNYNILDKFLDNLNNGQKVHKRATLYENINLNQIYKLFKDFRCRDDAAQTSFSVYADYLKEWYDRFQNGEEKTFPTINLAIFEKANRQRAQANTEYPDSISQAKKDVRPSFKTIIGGTSGGRVYKGDAFVDKPIKWHEGKKEIPSKIRQPDQPLLIAIYPLNPNYVRKTLYDTSKKNRDNPHGTRYNCLVELQPGEDNYIPGGNPILTFAAWTPLGGPTYEVGTNQLIAQYDDIRQIGLEQTKEYDEYEE
ncbi:Z1 domain-containing protein [Candidatus Poseidoniales archaeon]|nr:Z1 domain-containing protein [Candidatus Poseidoniales archaeon]